MKRLVWLALAVALAACGKSSGGDQPQPAPAPTPKPTPAPAPPDSAVPSGQQSLAPVFPGYSFGYAGVVTPDAPRFGETTATGVGLHDDQMSFHIWRGTLGDARTALQIQAQMNDQKYVETQVTPTELDYTMGDSAGVVVVVAGLLCGNGDPISAAHVDVYRKLCATLTADAAPTSK